MKRIWLAATLALGIPTAALAADHRDGPTTTDDATADINDVFAFLSDDGANLNLIMTVFPAALEATELSDAVQYVFHVNAGATIGPLPGDQTETLIICQFDAGMAECWGGDSEYVTGDASVEAGIDSESGDLRVFAGLRNDPFFFKLDGFNEARATVRDAADGLVFNDDGCPALNQETSDALVASLQSGGDFFAPLNTLAISIQVPISLVNGGGDIVGVWASTHARAE
jgi:hypothetical protein